MRWLTNARCHRLRMLGPHPWFAWHPVDIGGGHTVWLEIVLRQHHCGSEICWWTYTLP